MKDWLRKYIIISLKSFEDYRLLFNIINQVILYTPTTSLNSQHNYPFNNNIIL